MLNFKGHELDALFSEFEFLLSKKESIKEQGNQVLLKSDSFLKKLEQDPSPENVKKCQECAEELRRIRLESQPIYDRLGILLEKINSLKQSDQTPS